jgi:hypothetical protein
MTAPTVESRGLEKVFGQKVLDGPDLDVQRGSVLCLPEHTRRGRVQ